MPSLTISSGNPILTPFQPHAYQQTIPDGQTKGPTDFVVGEWDYKLQLDLWCKNKEERSQIFDDFFKGFNKAVGDDAPMGLSLQLPNYYNVWCRFDINDLNFLDDESSAERGERRAKIMVLCNVPAIRTQIVPIMKVIETTVETPDTIPNT